jgi:hypothetical protein
MKALIASTEHLRIIDDDASQSIVTSPIHTMNSRASTAGDGRVSIEYPDSRLSQAWKNKPDQPSSPDSSTRTESRRSSFETKKAYSWGNLDAEARHRTRNSGLYDTALSKAIETATAYTNNDLQPRLGTQTFMIFALPYDVSLADITSVIRGGKVIRLVLTQTNIAIVTFLTTSFAESKFWANIKQHGLIIKDKQVRVEKARKEPAIPKSVVQKAARFNARNLLMRRCAGEFSEKQLRGHLEHIHNLEVIGIRHEEGNIIISTNSVQYANTARDCMSSRKEYCKISFDWAADECEGSVVTVVSSVKAVPTKSTGRGVSHTRAMTANIFEILDLDTNFGSEAGEEIGF